MTPPSDILAAVRRAAPDLDASAQAAIAAEVTHTLTRPVKPDLLAHALGVERDWVYQHKHQLGAIFLGNGPKARMLFYLDPARERFHQLYAQDAPERVAPEPTPIARRRKSKPKVSGPGLTPSGNPRLVPKAA